MAKMIFKSTTSNDVYLYTGNLAKRIVTKSGRPLKIAKGISKAVLEKAYKSKAKSFTLGPKGLYAGPKYIIIYKS